MSIPDQGVEFVRAVSLPNFRHLAQTYHFLLIQLRFRYLATVWIVLNHVSKVDSCTSFLWAFVDFTPDFWTLSQTDFFPSLALLCSEKCDFEIWGVKGFSVFRQDKQLLKWLLEDQTWISKLETIHRRFLTRHKVGSSASLGLKKWGCCTFMAFQEHNSGFSVLAKSNLGADSRKTAPTLLLARTFHAKHLYVF